MLSFLERCMHCIVLSSYLSLTIFPSYATYSFNDAQIRFDLESKEDRTLTLKVYDNNTVLLESELRSALQGKLQAQDCTVKREGSNYKVKYQGKDNSRFDFLIDDAGNVSLLHNKIQSAFDKKKTWGIRTAGTISSNGNLDLYGFYIHAGAFHNTRVLYTPLFNFAVRYIYNSGAFLSGFHPEKPDLKNYERFIDPSSKPGYENGCIDNYGLLYAYNNRLQATNFRLRNHGYLSISALALKEGSSIESYAPTHIRELEYADGGSIFNSHSLSLGRIKPAAKLGELVNTGTLVFTEPTFLDESVSFLNQGSVISIDDFKAAQYMDFEDEGLFVKKSNLKSFLEKAVTLANPSLIAGQASHSPAQELRLAQQKLAALHLFLDSCRMQGITNQGLAELIADPDFQEMIEKVALAELLTPELRQKLLKEQRPADRILREINKNYTDEQSFVSIISQKDNLAVELLKHTSAYARLILPLMCDEEIRKVQENLKEGHFEEGLKETEFIWPKNTTFPFPENYLAKELLLRYLADKDIYQLSLNDPAEDADLVILAEHSAAVGEEQTFNHFFTHKKKPCLLRYTLTPSHALTFRFLMSPYSFYLMANPKTDIRIEGEKKELAFVALGGEENEFLGRSFDLIKGVIAATNGGFICSTPDLISLGRGDPERVVTNINCQGKVNYPYNHDYNHPNGSVLYIKGKSTFESRNIHVNYLTLKLEDETFWGHKENCTVINRGNLQFGSNFWMTNIILFDMQQAVDAPHIRDTRLHLDGRYGMVAFCDQPKMSIRGDWYGQCNEFITNQTGFEGFPPNVYVGGKTYFSTISGGPVKFVDKSNVTFVTIKPPEIPSRNTGFHSTSFGIGLLDGSFTNNSFGACSFSSVQRMSAPGFSREMKSGRIGRYMGINSSTFEHQSPLHRGQSNMEQFVGLAQAFGSTVGQYQEYQEALKNPAFLGRVIGYGLAAFGLFETGKEAKEIIEDAQADIITPWEAAERLLPLTLDLQKGSLKGAKSVAKQVEKEVRKQFLKKIGENPQWNIRPGQEWKEKIIGKAQKTGTTGHKFESYKEAIQAARSPDTEWVFLNRGYTKATGISIKSNRRPDVTVIKKDGTVNITEIRSKTDDPRVLFERNDEAMNKLPKEMKGEIKIKPANPEIGKNVNNR